MAVELVRIDDRLVHGQVLQGWVRQIKPTVLTVVNDFLCTNSLRKSAIELTLPSGLRFSVLSIEQAARRGDISRTGGEREIILFASPADVLRAVDKGLRLRELNLGGIHHFNGERVLNKNISLTREDVRDLKQLLSMGIKIMVRALPGDRGIRLKELL